MGEANQPLRNESTQIPFGLAQVDQIVHPFTAADINAAWARGMLDFRAAPAYGLVFGAFYAISGILLILAVWALSLSYLVYPLAAGFALIGPFAAVGLYEVSRRRELGIELSWPAVLGAVIEQRNRQLAWMALVVLSIFIVWMYQAQLLLTLLVGVAPFGSLHEFLRILTTTPEGLVFLLLGNTFGALLSLLLFSVTFISFPLLLDHDVDFVTAMIFSVRAVVLSLVPAFGWAVTIAALLVIASLPFFLGLVFVVPILGHTTWHLYRTIVVFPPTGSHR